MTSSTPAGRNWAGNVEFRAPRFAEPTTVEELAELVQSASRVRAVGSRHTFSALADSDDLMVSVEAVPGSVTVHAERGTASVPAGMRYAEAARELDAAGWALGAMASLPHITVAGAIATGTHGSGDAAGSLSDAVVALDILRADGDLITVRRGDPDFAGAVVALGSLGIVTRVEFAVEPSYCMTQVVDRGLPWDTALDDLDAVMGSADSVSLFTRWADAERIDQVWRKTRGRASRPPCRERTGPARPGIPSPAVPPRTAPTRPGCQARGSSACRTSVPSSRPRTGKSCSRSSSYLAIAPPTRSTPCAPSGRGCRRCCT
ncbi:MAG: FAD-binding protein [Microcella pacifica]